MHHFPSHKRDKAFTLIELLVVIAIIAILSVVVILTLNPAALLQQSRDANRVSDMSTLNSAIGLYLSEGGVSLGNSNTVYVSIPDPTATSTAGDQCQGLGLPTLPSTYTYQCAATSTFQSVTGQGWIPINFSSITMSPPISQLPIDPVNQSSTRLYYTYTTNGTQFEVTAAMESAKYQIGGSNDVISGDGGALASVYEKGSKLGLEPLDYGDTSLVGFWPLTEGTGTIAYDYSGNNATGTWNGSQAGTNGYYSPGKIGPWAGAFDGTSTVINLGNSNSLQIGNGTVTAWINTSNAGSNYRGIFVKNSAYGMFLNNNQFGLYDWATGWRNSGVSLNDGNWHFVACSFQTGVINGSLCYIDGVLKLATSMTVVNQLAIPQIGDGGIGSGQFFTGLINDVRIYNRALSASQIAAMYAGEK